MVQALYTLLQEENRTDEASKLLDSVLVAQPKSMVLRWIKATEQEKAGNLAAAIALYEEIYAEDSGNIVIANNLASLLAATSSDPKVIERASGIAKRLKQSDAPEFQDTYGWIAYLRGDYQEAVDSLEPAAAKLSGDASVQLHLGLAYAGLGKIEQAKTQLQLGLKLAGEGDSPLFQRARDELAKLENPPTPKPAPAPAPAP